LQQTTTQLKRNQFLLFTTLEEKDEALTQVQSMIRWCANCDRGKRRRVESTKDTKRKYHYLLYLLD